MKKLFVLFMLGLSISGCADAFIIGDKPVGVQHYTDSQAYKMRNDIPPELLKQFEKIEADKEEYYRKSGLIIVEIIR